MLTSLHIENFRAFRDLRIDGLARVNLITGANNTGKTALLEGLVMFLDPPSSPKIQGLPTLFRPVGGEPSMAQRPETVFWPWLMNDRSATGEFRISGAEASRVDRVRGWSLKPLAGRPARAEWVLGWSAGGATGNVWGTHSAKGDSVATFSTSPGNPRQDALDFNRVILKKRRKRVEEMLREVEPRLVTIESIHSDAGPMLHVDIGLPEMMPVTQLGQGFNRLLDIYSELVVEEARVLLIDEVENGLYWKTLPIVWRGLFAAAREWNVQVFATTHSAECIRAADEAARQGGDYDLAVVRLDRVDGEIKATTMGEETLRTAREFGWELR